MKRIGKFLFACAVFISAINGAATISGSVSLVQDSSRPKQKQGDNSGAVIWLESLGRKPRVEPGEFVIRQRRKRFEPHLLAIPIGSQVAFPNLDPIMHNVFSIHDGKPFDLGLYERGTSHSVTFSRAGICYVFCNIHPEMSATVIVLDTPWYAVSNGVGSFFIEAVPEGRYQVHVWHERASPANPREFPRDLTVSLSRLNLGDIRLIDSGRLIVPHKNKYGQDYPAQASDDYK